MVALVVAFEGAVAVLLRFRTVGWIGSASSIYLCAMAFLRWRGCVPGRMMRFLGDAHRIGLLRRVGPVYQFRHAKLQDRLAQTYRRSTVAGR